MSVKAPHFLLYAEVPQAFARAASSGRSSLANDAAVGERTRWRFVLRDPRGDSSLEAADEEDEASPQRLELLAVVRGLEALEQPSRVTLMSASRHLRRGLQFGLREWRENDWQWERYGRMVPVKDRDLWKRLDRLVQIHTIECGPGALEQASDLAPPPVAVRAATAPRRKSGGRAIRIDSGHRAVKHQAPSTKPQTNPKCKRQNDRNAVRLDHWTIRNWNLLGTAVKRWSAWSLVLGILNPKKIRRSRRALSAHRLRSTLEES
jgi:ribonuclease HI